MGAAGSGPMVAAVKGAGAGTDAVLAKTAGGVGAAVAAVVDPTKLKYLEWLLISGGEDREKTYNGFCI
jgi:hypothetical protein